MEVKENIAFKGKLRPLSNYYMHQKIKDIDFPDIEYPSVEHAFQAAKTLDKTKRQEIAAASSPGKAKFLGRGVKLRADWENIKVSIMEQYLRQKFQIKEIKEVLLKTGTCPIVEENTWHDNIWGQCTCANCVSRGKKGQNLLGGLLMKIRMELNEERFI